MNIEALAPGVRMALKALGFEPDKVVALMASIGTGIQELNAGIAAIRIQNDEILRRLENLEDGRSADQRSIEQQRTDDQSGSGSGSAENPGREESGV